MALARIAGLLYLIIAVCGGFSIGYVPSVIIADGDAATTAHKLTAHMGLFKLGALGDIVVLLAEVILTVLLYVLLRAVNQTLSLIALSARMLMVAVMAFLLLINIMAPVVLAGGVDPALAQHTALTLFMAHDLGTCVWQLFFGLHLMALGTLVIRSGYLPRLLGGMMLVGSFGYTLQGIAKITAVQIAPLNWLALALLVLVTIGELAFAFWLLIRGINDDAWHIRARQAVAI